ncbi:carboxypeptidase-like regulatory domain-containing protein [Hymenobacter sp. HD11105]
MRRLILFLTTLCLPFVSAGQARTITGKVVDEVDLKPIVDGTIWDRDNIRLGTTDQKGQFEIELPAGTNELVVGSIGMAMMSLKVSATCSTLEVILLRDVIYDFMSLRKINRQRQRIFLDLSNRHRQAYEQGVFTAEAPCFTYIFHKQ